MKFEFEILIDAGLEDVWAAFDNPANKSRWQQNSIPARTDRAKRAFSPQRMNPRAARC